MNYYIATKLENWKEHNRLRDSLNELGFKITYDWTSHGPVFKEGIERIREIALLEHDGIILADIVIMLWPGGRGTHVEIGMGIGMKKAVFIVSDIEDHHIASKETCAFYHHKYVRMFKSQEELIEKLTS